MTSEKTTVAQQRALVALWHQTGRALAAQRRAELAAQTPLRSRQSAFDMLQLGGMLVPDLLREWSSGLIEGGASLPAGTVVGESNRLLDAALEIEEFCRTRHWRFCFISGIAVEHWGEARLTRGADLTVFTGIGAEASHFRRGR